MADDLRSPLVPAECDLRDFAFMPLDVRRLLTSETWLLGSAEEKCAAMALWCEAWHQVPAASVPDNDRMLAHLSQAGSRWAKVKAHVLRSWIKCSDGRLYHPVVAEKVLESWSKKEMQRDRSRKANLARWGRNDPPPANPSGNGDGRVLGARMEESGGSPEDGPRGTSRIVQGLHEGHPQVVHDVIPNASHKESRDDPKGQGQGQGQGEKEKKVKSGARATAPPADPVPAGEGQPYPWPMIEVDGRMGPEEVPPEWVGDTYRSHPLVDGYAASEAFCAYWTEGKGAGATRTAQGWKQCWRGWIGREKAGRSTEWINRYGYNRHLHGHLVEAKAAAG